MRRENNRKKKKKEFLFKNFMSPNNLCFMESSTIIESHSPHSSLKRKDKIKNEISLEEWRWSFSLL